MAVERVWSNVLIQYKLLILKLVNYAQVILQIFVICNIDLDRIFATASSVHPGPELWTESPAQHIWSIVLIQNDL